MSENDHDDWEFWAGQPWVLDLSAAEFKPELPALFNSSCRDKQPERTITPETPQVLDAKSDSSILRLSQQSLLLMMLKFPIFFLERILGTRKLKPRQVKFVWILDVFNLSTNPDHSTP